MSFRLCSEAARDGNLSELMHLRRSQEGCPFDVSICDEAAGNGWLEVLQWARNDGCPWDHLTSDVHGMQVRVQLQQVQESWIFYSGQRATDVHGIQELVRQLHQLIT